MFLVIIAQISNHIAELVIPVEMPCREAKTETEMHPITTEAKLRKCSI